jgi:hypothetical protein
MGGTADIDRPPAPIASEAYDPKRKWSKVLLDHLIRAQQERFRNRQAERLRCGGSAIMLNFPDKPKGMHWRTYDRLCRVHDAAEERSIIGA